MDANKQWMAKGKIGCAFAAMFARKPESIGWVTVVNPEKFEIPEGCFILSLQFPDKTKPQVIEWALQNGFYEEQLNDGMIGLRRDIDNNVSWVQYFGRDSHVETRKSPIPELLMCVKLPAKYYAKVGFKGVLHLAHASVESLTERASDILWKSSFTNTAKRLGFKPTIKEAAKTTYENTDNRASVA